jgi:phage baseplate assembly protein W
LGGSERVKGMSATTGKPLDGADHLRQSVADILGTPLGSRVGRHAVKPFEKGSLISLIVVQDVGGNDLKRVGHPRLVPA